MHGCSPLAYREQRQVRLPNKERDLPEPLSGDDAAPGFTWRGMKGWFWTAEQYLQEIQVLASLKMNFLMDCYGSMILSQPGEPWCNEWWKPMTDARKQAYGQVIEACGAAGITFCFALHPQLASPRPLDPTNSGHLDLFYAHYAWAQEQGVRWFSVCLDGTSWGSAGPAACGKTHAGLVSAVLERLRRRDRDAQLAFCPIVCWGDGTNPEHHAYLEALAQELHPAVFIFWNGDSIVTPRITRVAAASYHDAGNPAVFVDNYPVMTAAHAASRAGDGREADLCTVIDGYLSNQCARKIRSTASRWPRARTTLTIRAPTTRPFVSQAILRFAKHRLNSGA